MVNTSIKLHMEMGLKIGYYGCLQLCARLNFVTLLLVILMTKESEQVTLCSMLWKTDLSFLRIETGVKVPVCLLLHVVFHVLSTGESGKARMIKDICSLFEGRAGNW